MKNSIGVLLFLGLLLSCNNAEQEAKIVGKWNCSSWVNKNMNVDKCGKNTYFEFNADKTYNSKTGALKDTGEYKIISDVLYVTPKGKVEFGVEITKLNTDTLVFLMNAAGSEEVLTLVK